MTTQRLGKTGPDYFTQISNIRDALEQDIDACDMKWSLFVAAAKSRRYNSRLKPYPPNYHIQTSNELLLCAIDRVPAFQQLLYNIRENCLEHFDNEIVDLLHWAIVTQNDPSLKSIPRNLFPSVLGKVKSVLVGPEPTHIFEVTSRLNCSAESKFKQFAEGMNTIYAFHGSHADSFHSILHYGLQQHLCKTALFGEGIYLSSEIHVSMTFSTYGAGWRASNCGDMLSCIAICEIIEHPEHLKHHTKDSHHENGVPDKYYIVTNNEIVRLRYLIVYGQRTQLKRTGNFFQNPLLNWAWNNKSIVTIYFYIFILLSIGLVNTPSGSYWLHRFLQTIKYYLPYNVRF